MSKILFVLTSNPFMLDGTPTGLWLEEFAVPYMALATAGHDVTVSSVVGGQVPVDPNSAPSEEQKEAWAAAIAKLENTPSFEAFSAEEFDAIYMPGGHGTVFDMPFNKKLHDLIFAFDKAGKVVSSVCHAPAVFGGMRDENGLPFVKGRTLAAFTNSEEEAAGATKNVPFLLETRLIELGAIHQRSDDWTPKAVRDGNLITGQNPQSSAAVAELLKEALA
ncbi:type 1 glutamine amidotransferase domain-containing protein [Pseudovibrio exalbescens]|uniref:type 1 glutamine amidotransferase domain-containing protein n=1 Tax=Pseudovibrio exalbescens TaxID=197461 RepID=UPI00236693DE|nr:type 1 glutamine amidotransferase domain-containing protein [Pseudovibrio exalbescens]MDD7910783.1 type 1 glutamine amidotransferase domain-containing protein [Pseudovibrio exalbescens]